MIFTLVLPLIGGVTVTCIFLDSIWSLLELVSSYLMPFFQPGEEQALTKRFGTWAAVTGSTDGIGKQYALELARRGLNVVLISRNPDKLKHVADEIEKKYSVKTKVIVADFSRGAEVYPRIEEELRDVPLGILVNNVGTQYEYPMPLCELAPGKAWEIINVNVGAVTAMSRMVLPGMLARGRGALVNVSSGSENQPLALMAVYAASKSYVRSFTLAVREEYSSAGIHVQHVAPFFVATKMNSFSQKMLDGNLMVPDSEAYARYAVSMLGRVSSTSGYWAHGFQAFFTKLAPMWLRIKIGSFLNHQLRDEYMRNNKLKTN